MINPNGTITLNGITDPEMVKIWEFKAKNEGSFSFQPQQFQVSNHQGKSLYNNVTFLWNGEAGLKVMHEILGFLIKKEERGEAAQ